MAGCNPTAATPPKVLESSHAPPVRSDTLCEKPSSAAQGEPLAKRRKFDEAAAAADAASTTDEDSALAATMAAIGPPPTPPAGALLRPPPVDARDRGAVVAGLRARGYCALALTPSTEPAMAALVAALRAAVAAPTGAASTLQNGRRATNIPESDGSVRDAVVGALRTTSAGAAIRAYVGARLEVQGVQDIAVPGVDGCGPQELHRDHQLGPRRAAVLALSLDGSPLRTEVVPGTHNDGAAADSDEGSGESDADDRGGALSRYVSAHRYSTKRAPKAAAMLAHLRRADLLAPVDAAAMVYDPYVYHRGAPCDGALTAGRVFIMLCDADLPADAKRAMRSTNDIKKGWKNVIVRAPP